MDRAALREWISKRPEIAEQLLRVLARRLRRTNNMLADLIFTDVPGRVAKALLQLARQFGSQESGLLRVTHDLTQEEIAQLVGASPGDGEQGAGRLRPPRLAAAGGQERADPGARAPGPPGPVRAPPDNNWYGRTRMCHPGRHVQLVVPRRLPRRAHRTRALPFPRCPRRSAGCRGDVRAGHAALRPGRDRLVRRRPGWCRRACSSASRAARWCRAGSSTGSGRPGRCCRRRRPRGRGVGAVRRHRAGSRCALWSCAPALAGARPARDARRVPRVVDAARARRAAAGTPRSATRRSAWRCSSSSGRRWRRCWSLPRGRAPGSRRGARGRGDGLGRRSR